MTRVFDAARDLVFEAHTSCEHMSNWWGPRKNAFRSLRFATGERRKADLADRIGVTRQTIIAIERGRCSPSLQMAFQIARVFNVPSTRCSNTRAPRDGHPTTRPCVRRVLGD